MPATAQESVSVSPPSAQPRRLPAPSLADWLFVALVGWLVLFTIAGDGKQGLLSDAGTGVHIRTGEQIVERATVPRTDPFSFTKPGAAWFAWEWLADLAYAAVYRVLDLKGVVLLAAVMIAGSVWLALRHSLWRGADPLVALLALHIGIAASSVHYLARPHAFTLLLMAGSLWLIDWDRREKTKAVWILVPLAALWANLHGGFAGLIVSLGLLAAGSAVESVLWGTPWVRVRRYLLLTVGCLTASTLNPFGISLHIHMLQYLRADWIRELVQEFKPPSFASAAGAYVELLIIGGILAAGALIGRRKISEGVLILAWVHAALLSMRHAPILAIVAVPAIASEASALWIRYASRKPSASMASMLARLSQDHAAGFRRASLWAAVAILGLGSLGWRGEFPAGRYPAELYRRHSRMIESARVFSTDSWSDYLIYRSAEQRVFFDGRSDFYGEQLSRDYVHALNGRTGWSHILDSRGVDLVLVPNETQLAGLLELRENWQRVDGDELGVIFRRR